MGFVFLDKLENEWFQMFTKEHPDLVSLRWHRRENTLFDALRNLENWLSSTDHFITVVVAYDNWRPECFLRWNDLALNRSGLLNRARTPQQRLHWASARFPLPLRQLGTCSPQPRHAWTLGGSRRVPASLWKGFQLLLKKIAFVLQFLLMLVWPWLSVANETK